MTPLLSCHKAYLTSIFKTFPFAQLRLLPFHTPFEQQPLPLGTNACSGTDTSFQVPNTHGGPLVDEESNGVGDGRSLKHVHCDGRRGGSVCVRRWKGRRRSGNGGKGGHAWAILAHNASWHGLRGTLCQALHCCGSLRRIHTPPCTFLLPPRLAFPLLPLLLLSLPSSSFLSLVFPVGFLLPLSREEEERLALVQDTPGGEVVQGATEVATEGVARAFVQEKIGRGGREVGQGSGLEGGDGEGRWMSGRGTWGAEGQKARPIAGFPG